jgi:hypothetical protein
MKKCLQILAAPTGKLSSDLEEDFMTRENALEQLECVVDIIDNARGKLINNCKLRSYTSQVDNLAKIPARSCQDLIQDLSKIMPRSYINPARSWKDLARSCKIFPSSCRILCKILQDLSRSCQDPGRSYQTSCKILP